MTETAIDCHLYLISPSSFDLDSFKSDLEEAVRHPMVQSFQLRMKDAPREDIRAAIQALMPICHQHDVAFILNDDAQLAGEMQCDGVHLGQNDGSIKEVRQSLGFDMIIGATCHDSLDLGYRAGEEGADYVAFGAFYPTTTKETHHQPDPEILSLWADATELPVVAIGGITAENAAPLVKAGAHFLAVSGFVWQHPKGIAPAVEELATVISSTTA